MTVLWGWIPNLSGTVFTAERFLELTKNSEGIFGDGTYLFRYCDDDVERSVEVVDGDDSRPILRIILDDVSGMCHVEIPDDDRSNMVADTVWKAFRSSIDGCADMVYDCTAMDRLVRSESTDPAEAIARRFIETLETDADFSAHVVADGRFRGDDPNRPTFITRARFESNRLYFEAFMDFYSERFSETSRRSLIAEADRRVRKNLIVSDYLDRRYQRNYNSIAFRMSVAAIIVALVVGIFGVIGRI